jgi:hypothetical protein
MPERVQSAARREEAKRRRRFSDVTLGRRIALAVYIVAAVIALNHWVMGRVVPGVSMISDLLISILALIFVFRPGWFDFWKKSEEKRVEDWHAHPGQWS